MRVLIWLLVRLFCLCEHCVGVCVRMCVMCVVSPCDFCVVIRTDVQYICLRAVGYSLFSETFILHVFTGGRYGFGKLNK